MSFPVRFRLFAASCVAGGFLAASAPASAQFYHYGPLGYHRGYGYFPPPTTVYELSPRQINQMVTRQGYRPEAFPVYDDEVAVVVATDTLGRRMRLTVDSYSGRIVARRPLDAGKPRQQVAARPLDQKAAPPKQPDASRSNAAPLAPPPPAKPPVRAEQPKQPAQALGTRAAPRRIDIPPPAALDGGDPPRGPAQAPINSVPPAVLD
jgi:hypothetical protein